MAFVLKEDRPCDEEKESKHLQLIQLFVRKTVDHEEPDLRTTSARVLLALKHHMGESFPVDFDELLNREMFDTLFEAKVIVERWRGEYNHIRPYTLLNYRPPAPEVILPIYVA